MGRYYLVDPCYVIDDAFQRIRRCPIELGDKYEEWPVMETNGDGLVAVYQQGSLVGSASVDSGELGVFSVEALEALSSSALEQAQAYGVPLVLADPPEFRGKFYDRSQGRYLGAYLENYFINRGEPEMEATQPALLDSRIQTYVDNLPDAEEGLSL